MNSVNEFGVVYAAEQLRRSRAPLRKFVKSFYLQNILCDVKGKTIDFGCGAGQLLARLPAGSVGLEVNSHLVTKLRRAGLNAQLYDVNDNFSFHEFLPGHYQTFVMAHVLEHFDHADNKLRKILHSCYRIGIEHIVIIVPGAEGFRSDPTHRTFVNKHYLIENQLLICEGYALREATYFPMNFESIGNHFVFHELKLIYDRRI
jgi:SAM-dependent methyltransferase